MENCSGDHRCLICRRVALENSSIESEKLVSNASLLSLLQNFLNCFHVNVLDSKVNNFSISCQFCPTCEQFIAEWSSIQTQMTLLTRRAAQLKATLSALLLSTPEIHLQTQDDYLAKIISNNRIPNSQEIELPLQLQQTVDEIRDELQKKYSVLVKLDKIPLPLVQNLDVALPYEDVDEASDHGAFVADDSDVEYLPSEDELDDEVTPGQFLEIRIKTEDGAFCDESGSQDCVDYEDMNVKAGKRKASTRQKSRKKRRADYATTILDRENRFVFKGMSFQLNQEDQTYTCDACSYRSGPTMQSIKNHLVRHLRKKATRTRKKHFLMIPNGPNRFKYNGYDITFNDQDQCYECGPCNLEGLGHKSVSSILSHIRGYHYTAEDKIKFTAVRKSDTEWLYGGKYKIIKVEAKKFKCVSCGCTRADLHKMVTHVRNKHVELEGSDQVIPLPEKDTPSFNCSNQSSDHHAMFDKIQLPGVLKLDPVPTDNVTTVDEAWDHWECQANIQLPVVPKIESWDHSEFAADDSDEEYLPSAVDLNDEETSEQIFL